MSVVAFIHEKLCMCVSVCVCELASFYLFACLFDLKSFCNKERQLDSDDSKQTNNTNFTIMNISSFSSLFASAIRLTMFAFEIYSPYDECL